MYILLTIWIISIAILLVLANKIKIEYDDKKINKLLKYSTIMLTAPIILCVFLYSFISGKDEINI